MRLHSEDNSWENASGKWGILKGIEKRSRVMTKCILNETDGV